MAFEAAPFHQEVAAGPPGTAHWAETSDGVRIRLAHWRPDHARGTVLLLPGRSEYVEKYGIVAKGLGARGYATLAIDWRGQGLADRLLDDARIGHVVRFTDYQKDLAAALRYAQAQDLPRPWFMIGHSMGGGIGLRAVIEGLAVKAAAFTGPMWGIYMSPLVKPFGWMLSHAAPAVGLGTRLPPTTRHENYVLAETFEGNVLTRDAQMYALMHEQMSRHPELALGGPSLIWFREALVECRTLAARPSPDLPAICFVGAGEKIVDVEACRRRMAIWPRGELDVIPGAEHEVLMETPDVRTRIFDKLDRLFSDAAAADDGAARSA